MGSEGKLYMNRLMIVGVACAALTACATTQQPAIQIREVPVPVPQPCLTEEELAQDRYQEPGSVRDQLEFTDEAAKADRDVLAALAQRLRAWGIELRAAHEACAQ